MKLNRRKHQSGFTLIELLVVIILVAILAAVGIPLLTANIERAKLTEADASLSMVKTGMRAYFAEHATYVDASSGAAPTFPAIGIKEADAAAGTPGDLDGRYFNTVAFSIPTVAATTFCAGVDGGSSTAPQAGDVSGLDRSMDQDGYIYDDSACAGTCLNC